MQICYHQVSSWFLCFGSSILDFHSQVLEHIIPQRSSDQLFRCSHGFWIRPSAGTLLST